MVWAAIGAAAISTVGGYINNQQQAKALRSSSGSSSFDPNVQAGTNQAITTAQGVANQQWSGIDPSIAVAGLTPNQIAAQQEAAALGEQLPGLDATATQAFNQGNLQKYMDPYEADVLDVQKQYATRDYTQQQAALASKDVMNSSFGGDRSVLANNALTRDYNLNLENIQKTGLSNAFNFGVGAFNQDRSYAAGEGSAIRGALSSTGAVAQATNQNLGNFKTAQFNEQRDWAKNQNAYLAQILGQVPKGSAYSGNMSSYNTPAGGGWGGALAGASQIGLAGLSAYNNNNPSTPANSGDMTGGVYNGGAFGGGAPLGNSSTGYPDTPGPMPTPSFGPTTGAGGGAFDFSLTQAPPMQSVPGG